MSLFGSIIDQSQEYYSFNDVCIAMQKRNEVDNEVPI